MFPESDFDLPVYVNAIQINPDVLDKRVIDDFLETGSEQNRSRYVMITCRPVGIQTKMEARKLLIYSKHPR